MSRCQLRPRKAIVCFDGPRKSNWGSGALMDPGSPSCFPWTSGVHQSRQLLSLDKNIHNCNTQTLRGFLNRTQGRCNASRCIARCFLRRTCTHLRIMTIFLAPVARSWARKTSFKNVRFLTTTEQARIDFMHRRYWKIPQLLIICLDTKKWFDAGFSSESEENFWRTTKCFLWFHRYDFSYFVSSLLEFLGSCRMLDQILDHSALDQELQIWWCCCFCWLKPRCVHVSFHVMWSFSDKNCWW